MFYLKDVADNKHIEEIGTRYEIRRAYWKYALPIIQEAFGEIGPFSNVNPTKENWVNGFVGISGVAITCVANYDRARVDLCLNDTEKSINKQRFDYLIAHKSEAETALGRPLIWNRSDETKVSYVSYALPDVSIASEIDWIMMAKFHAEWSKKFCDVLVPLLQEWNRKQ